MKSYYSLFRDKKVFGFALFQVFFFMFMWLSKTSHILFFEEAGKVENFGIAYSAMALSGYFSFLFGHFVDRMGLSRAIGIGGILYSTGLFLRAFPNSLWLCGLSGVVAGVGASFVLCSLTIWMVQITDQREQALLIGLKSSTSSLGTAIGCLLVGILPALGKDLMSFRLMLLISSFGIFILTTTTFFSLKIKTVTTNKNLVLPWRNFLEAFNESKGTAIVALILGTTTGFYVSFISPYLPLIMKDKGISLFSIGLTTASFSAVRFFIDPFVSHFVANHKNRSLSIYIAAETAIALVLGLLLLPVTKWAFVLILLIRSMLLGFSTISEELLWLNRFPKRNLGLFIGLNQSAYFIGDFFGGISNGFLYKSYGLNQCILFVILMMATNGILFIRFFQRSQRQVEVLC